MSYGTIKVSRGQHIFNTIYKQERSLKENKMKITKSQLHRIIKEEMEKELNFDFEEYMREYATNRPELNIWSAGDVENPYIRNEEGIEDILTIGFKTPDKYQKGSFVTLYSETHSEARGVSFHTGSDDVPDSKEDADDLLMEHLYPDEWHDTYADRL